MYDDPAFDKSKTLAMLRAKSVVRAEVEFSGGNDEGGVNEITLFKADDSEETLQPYYGGGYSFVDGKWKAVDTPATDDQILAQQLAAPVDAEYGSFAGDFYVYGRVVVDVVAGTVKIHKTESVPTDHDYEYEF